MRKTLLAFVTVCVLIVATVAATVATETTTPTATPTATATATATTDRTQVAVVLGWGPVNVAQPREHAADAARLRRNLPVQ